MASKLEHPERVVGLHFFNPVAVLPLLEVVRAEQTDDAALATAFAVGKALKKSCVLVADAPAFVVNRLLTRFLGEITSAVEQGTPVAVADRALAEEIRLMLDEGVVQAVQDIDLCMLLGAGWPFWLGGISAYLDRAGVSEAVTGKRFLPPGVASLPA